MTCYMRHMDWLFQALELPYDKEHRKQVDSALREELQMPSEYHCPEVWASIKTLSEDERSQLANDLRSRFGR
jgi:hypothetical protein